MPLFLNPDSQLKKLARVKNSRVIMASASDTEMEYLSPSFDPTSLTVPRLRAILVSHDISYPASAKKQQLVDIFTQELVPRSRRILAARSRTRRTSKGIIDMPSSQESTEGGDNGRNATMVPPPVPDVKRRVSRRSERSVTAEENLANSPANGKLSRGENHSIKHARPSDTETEPDSGPKEPIARKTRRSEGNPVIKIEPPLDSAIRPSLGESTFSDDNPFQSGSSPLAHGESRRRSAGTGVSKERRKSSSRRRKTESVGHTLSQRTEQGDGVVVPSSKTFEVPLSRLRNAKSKDKTGTQIEAGEDFTPEEQMELIKERAANGNRDVLPPRMKKVQTSGGIPRSAPWVILVTLFLGYGMWWRREKLELGYCGIGKTSNLLSDLQIPEWASYLQPECEPCPQHAICYEQMETKCDFDFVLQPHPLSFWGLLPLPPTCEPDGEKVRRVKVVADRAVEELRERKAKWECGTLVDENGKGLPKLEQDEQSLKKEVAKKRRRSMSEAEFEELWKGALGEISGREDVVQSVDG